MATTISVASAVVPFERTDLGLSELIHVQQGKFISVREEDKAVFYSALFIICWFRYSNLG